MKRWLILAMLAASFTAFGQERAVNDLMYLPLAKTFYSKATYDIATQKGELKDTTDADYRIETKTASLDLGYSVHDNLSFELGLGYQGISNLNQPDGAAETELSSKGLLNPTARFKWRALEQNKDDVLVDLIPYFSFKTGNAKDPVGSSRGNVTVGNGYGIEANVGRKLTDSQYMGFVKIKHTMSYESSKTIFDPQTSYEIGGTYQKSLTKSLFGNLSLSRIQFDDYRNDEKNTSNYLHYAARSSWALGVEALMTPMQNLALSLGYKHYLIDDYAAKDQTGNKTNFENNKAHALTMFARYQF